MAAPGYVLAGDQIGEETRLVARIEVDRTWLARSVSAGLDVAVVRVLTITT
jgi:hypothetical protein